MKKFSLIPLALIILVGAIWASSIITPDKPGFPSLPTSPGTLGYVLGLFGPDGTAPDTRALSGVTATGYLHKVGSNCTLPGEVWRGFNTDGTVRCEAKGVLLAIGRFSDIYPGVTISSDGGVNWTPANTTDTLYEGYLVRSDASGTGTIRFLDDDSIIRMDVNTIVQLERGSLDGNTVAQAIINDGRLWGRILSSTGVNFGGGGYIAGVRGTSIAITHNPSTHQAEVYIPHSTRSTSAVKISTPQGGTPINGNVGTSLPSLSTTSPNIPGGGTIPTRTTSDLYTVLSASGWIVKNTKKDILYLDQITKSVTQEARRTMAINELAATLPKGGTLECAGLITGKSIDQATLQESTESIEGDTRTSVCDPGIVPTGSTFPIEIIKCGLTPGKRWWKGLGDCGPIAIAYADLSRGSTLYIKNGEELEARYESGGTIDGNYILDNGYFAPGGPFDNPEYYPGSSSRQSTLWSKIHTSDNGGPIQSRPWARIVYIKNRSGGTPYMDPYSGLVNFHINQYAGGIWYLSGVIDSPTYTAGNSDGGMKITQAGQYLTYPINSIGNMVGFSGATLKNRTVTIELGSPVGTNLSPSWTKAYVADFGTTDKYFVMNNKNCSGGSDSGKKWFCKAPTTTIANVTTATTLTFSGIISPTQMIVGNLWIPSISASHLQAPIGTIIKKITISTTP